jgi:hypothetical protein
MPGITKKHELKLKSRSRDQIDQVIAEMTKSDYGHLLLTAAEYLTDPEPVSL